MKDTAFKKWYRSRKILLILFLKAIFSLVIIHVQYVCVCCQGAAAYPENEDQQQRLREAAEGLRVATNAAAQNAIKKKLINRLEVSEVKSEQTTRHLCI